MTEWSGSRLKAVQHRPQPSQVESFCWARCSVGCRPTNSGRSRCRHGGGSRPGPCCAANKRGFFRKHEPWGLRFFTYNVRGLLAGPKFSPSSTREWTSTAMLPDLAQGHSGGCQSLLHAQLPRGHDVLSDQPSVLMQTEDVVWA